MKTNNDFVDAGMSLEPYYFIYSIMRIESQDMNMPVYNPRIVVHNVWCPNPYNHGFWNVFFPISELPLVEVWWESEDADGEAGEGSFVPKLNWQGQSPTAVTRIASGAHAREEVPIGPPAGYGYPWQWMQPPWMPQQSMPPPNWVMGGQQPPMAYPSPWL
jgi:hypothetical protein